MRKKLKKEKKLKNKPVLKEKIEIPECWQAAVSKLVSYYDEGWRYGYLEEFTKTGQAKIRPIAIGGHTPQLQTLPLSDLKLLPEKQKE